MHAKLTLLDGAQSLDERRHIKDVTQTLTVCLKQQRERRVARCDAQQVIRSLSQLPERRTLIGAAARQQQRAPGGLAKSAREERSRPKLAKNHLHGFGRFNEDPVWIGWLVSIGKAENKPIVAPERFHFRAAGSADPGADRHGPGNVDAAAERCQYADAPVAKFVAGPLNHNRSIVGDLPGSGFLIGQELQQILRCARIEIMLSDKAGERGGLRQRPQFAHQRTDATSKLQRTPWAIALPERHLARFTGSRNNKHPIMRNVFDAPGRRAENKGLVGMGLEDHLLVEFAHANGLALGVCEKDSVETAIRDRSSVEDGEAACAVASCHHIANAIPGQARSQFGKLIRGIPAAQKIENAVERRASESAKRRSTTHEIVERIHMHLGLLLLFRCVRGFPCLEIQTRGTHFARRTRSARPAFEGFGSSGRLVPRRVSNDRNELLAEHVQRIAWKASRFDVPLVHGSRHGGTGNQVGAVFRKQHAFAHRIHGVASAADALHAASDRRRSLDLNDEVDRSHIDAKFQRRSGTERFDLSGLQLLLDH